MKNKCSIVCYYEGYDAKGNVLINGNHACDVEYDDQINGGEYVINTCEYILNDLKPSYPTLMRIVLKHIVKL